MSFLLLPARFVNVLSLSESANDALCAPTILRQVLNSAQSSSKIENGDVAPVIAEMKKKLERRQRLEMRVNYGLIGALVALILVDGIM
jgi:hypothetical protein